MATIIEEISLVMSDCDSNHNKVWHGYLFDDNSVKTEWGRIGLGFQSKIFPSGGKRFLDKKKDEKLKKGYVVLQTVKTDGPNVSSQKAIAKTELAKIALSQIKRGNGELDKLIERLVSYNIHSILANTAITYNSDTGLFSTPLGIVTPEGIKSAREILEELAKMLRNQELSEKFTAHVNKYLMLIPKSLGMGKFKAVDLFPNMDEIQKQNDILDSLESSYKALTTQPAVEKKNEEVEKIFNVELDILQDTIERERIIKKYSDSNKPMHGYQHIKIKEIYKIKITDTFNSKVGNIVEVYHGSNCANILSVLKSGLKCSPPNTAAVAGKLYGGGTYGSETASKSLGYTALNRWGNGGNGAIFMFICDFAMGNAFYPKTFGISGISKEYDSCWALPKNVPSLRNDELIVYKDSQIRIKYLLELE